MSRDVESDCARDLVDLRHELKRWEKAFAEANRGNRAGRADIEKDANISAKYREYNRLTKKGAKQNCTPRKEERLHSEKERTQPLRERSSNVVNSTPKKSMKATREIQSQDVITIVEEEPTPACVRHALGPTPQKDGAILGLFDGFNTTTPSKAIDTCTVRSEAVIEATPSKSVLPPSSELALSTTPQSSGKRFHLGAYLGTPLKRKRHDDTFTPSTAKRQWATPTFLRRNFPLGRIDEERDEVGTAAPPFKKRNLVRSLSTIIQSLKKHEEERMDDEWDVMNEIEAEENGETVQPDNTEVLVEDSQAIEMPLGPDLGIESADEASEIENGIKPRKPWKKKGLKRQTRRVIMRPVTNKPKKAADGISSDSEESEPDMVAETQMNDQATKTSRPAKPDSLSLGEGDTSDYQHDSQQSHHKPTEKPKKRKKSKKTEASQPKQAEDASKAMKKTSKVNALAHTNFRKLNIKNKNSKANGRGRKFGRR